MLKWIRHSNHFLPFFLHWGDFVIWKLLKLCKRLNEAWGDEKETIKKLNKLILLSFSENYGKLKVAFSLIVTHMSLWTHFVIIYLFIIIIVKVEFLPFWFGQIGQLLHYWCFKTLKKS